MFNLAKAINTKPTTSMKLLAPRVTKRYGKLGTFHSNQSFLKAVDRDIASGQFVSRKK